ncbi:MAG: ATPase, T2SS/T4P/T4SS family [Promethearchaeota archaeon]
MIHQNNIKPNIQRKDNLEGKREKVLNIECIACSDYSKQFWKNKKCYHCLFDNVKNTKDRSFAKIYIQALDISIDQKTTKLIVECIKNTEKTKKYYSNLLKLRESCVFKDSFKCKIFEDFKSFFALNEQEPIDPISLYLKIEHISKQVVSISSPDPICSECLRKCSEIVDQLLLHLNSELIRKYKTLQQKSSLFADPFYFYEFLITKSHSIDEVDDKSSRSNIKFGEINREGLLHSYQVAKGLYQIQIYRIANKTEKIYHYQLFHESESEKAYFEKLVENILLYMDILRFDETVPLENLISLYKREALRIIELNYKMPANSKKKVAFYAALKFLQLNKLFPFLVDNYIEEIFLDSPKSYIYIDHQKYGRCRTNINLSVKDIERIITLLRLYSEQRLDYSNPTLKYVIKNKYFYCRFAIDVKPININNFSLDIRKLNKNILTLQDLMKTNTFNPKMAAFLFFCVIRGVNITVTGKTDTGKTTLINAFDLISPEYFRKIYVENVTESLEQLSFNKHQVKYQADSLDSDSKERYTKSNHIKTLLHRTPDIIYLGEILEKEEAEAMFHCLAAGLKGFQTIHSQNIDSLINRLIHTFGINFEQLDDLDILVLMNRELNKRRIVSISEIDLTNYHSGDYYREIFLYDPEAMKWNLIKDLYETKIVTNLKKFENLNKKIFNDFMILYEEIFSYLLNHEKIQNNKLVDLFHELAHYSIISHLEAQNFWEKWKSQHYNLRKEG